MRLSKLLAIVLIVLGVSAATAVAKVQAFKPVRAGNVLKAPKSYQHRKVRSYRWERCGRLGRSCRKVKGATHRTYRVRASDVGHAFRVELTVQTANGKATVTSAPTPPIAPPDPVNVTLPTIGGVAEQGQALTSDPGTWQNAVSLEYQWEDCDSSGNNCSTIAGATGTTYALQPSDVGHTIRLAVTAFNTPQAQAAALSGAV